MRQGFFNKSETQSNEFHKGKRVGCHQCTLFSQRDKTIATYGNFKKGILNIFEFVDGGILDWLQTNEGKVLANEYQIHGIDIVEDCLNICAVRCANSRAQVTPDSVNNCRKSVVSIIREKQPKLINSFGSLSIQSLIADRFSGNVGEISKWQGYIIPDQEYKCWIAFMHSPSYIIKNDNQAVGVGWKKEIATALSHIEKSWVRDKKPNIEFIEDLNILSKLPTNLVSIDFETTGIKPHAEGHRIVCASVAYTPNDCYVFMMPAKRRERFPFLNLMWSDKIDKMAHNMKFEDTWTNVRLRQPVRGWYWDSMIAAHILNNQAGVSGLKFQTYVHFGVIDYSSEISPYLKSDDKSANGINKIHELLDSFGGRERLLTYCGMDTIYQYRLALKQMELMGYDDLPF